MVAIRPRHWQLRSLVSAEKPNILYFPAGGESNPHIQRLNTTSCETETLKLLPFQPRCLVARNGWVCCGGEHGEFTAIRLDDEEDSSDLDLRLALGSDTRPPPDDDSSRLEDSIFSILAGSRSNKSVAAKSKKFGKDRVNCITLWFPPSLAEPCDGAYTKPIAVLSNNDKTVSLVSLHNQDRLDQVPYPDCVNRAVVSPDGRLLIAISDDPYLYVHERCEKQGTSTRAFEWRARNRIHLKSQRTADRSDNRGSFAACFSSTGAYLAVGTQYGMISIFDTGSLVESDVDSVLTSFTSSRPDSELGAVRDMAFAPGPIDLLAWTEDRGRVGVADLRSNFFSRQILELDKTDTYDHIAVIDTSSIDPRLLDRRSDRSDRNDNLASLASGLDLSTEARQSSRSEAIASIERYNHPLTTDETMVLEALQDHGRRRAQRTAAQTGAAPRFPYIEGSGRSTTGADSPRARDSDSPRARDRSASVSRAVNEIMGNLRDQRERLRDSQERLRVAVRDESDAERRRPVVPPQHRRAGVLGATATSADNDTQSSWRTLSRLVANNPTAFGGWVDLEVLHNFTFDGQDGLPSATENDTRRRDRAAYLRRDLDENPYRRSPGAYTSRDPRPDPHDTAGLSWSEDGRTL